MSSGKSDHADGDGLSMKGNGIILVELAFIAMMVMFIEIMLVPALPLIAKEFPNEQSWAPWVLSAYLLVGAVATPLVGRLGDMYGKKKVMLAAMVIYTAGLAGCAFSWSMASLIGFRAVQGIGMGMFPLAFGIVRDTFPKRFVPMAIGIISAMFSVGVSIGLLGGGWIIQQFDWRTAFHIVWPLMALMLVVVLMTIKESPVRQAMKLDILGTAMMGFGIGSFLLALSQGKEWGWTSALTLGLFSLAAVLIVGFIVWERRVPNPIVSMRLMANRGIAGVNLTALFVGLGMFLFFQTLPYFLMGPRSIGGLGLADTFEVGVYMFPSAIAQLIFAPLAGKWSKKIGADRILMAGMLLMVAGYALLIGLHADELQIALSMFVMGIGLGFAMVSLINVTAMASPRKDFGLASGMNTLFRVVGGSIGPVIGTAITAGFAVAIIVPGHTIMGTSVDGYIWAWTAGMVFSGIGFLVALILRPGKGLDYENDVEQEAGA
ncbi:MAG: bicyclomycin/multidrug efflux system [Methanomassiliicoccales archaeon PtaU1.Bin124]|nr:MAG: bicyclomycin/multidrug efflux system [Methanomassiliicoccales archaeon PtaU1.Bin124]